MPLSCGFIPKETNRSEGTGRAVEFRRHAKVREMTKGPTWESRARELIDRAAFGEALEILDYQTRPPRNKFRRGELEVARALAAEIMERSEEQGRNNSLRLTQRIDARLYTERRRARVEAKDLPRRTLYEARRAELTSAGLSSRRAEALAHFAGGPYATILSGITRGADSRALAELLNSGWALEKRRPRRSWNGRFTSEKKQLASISRRKMPSS